MRSIAVLFLLMTTFANAGIIRQNVRHFSKSGNTGLTGDVTISEGTGITLTQINQNITISATAAAASAEAFTSIAANYNVLTTDYNIIANASAGGISVTAFSAAGNSGHVFCVKKPYLDATANPITVASSDKIDGQGTLIITQSKSAFCFKTDGSTFYVF